jgi:hypothetical protein
MTDLLLMLIVLAATFGAVAVIIVSVFDFHTPYKVSDIRYAVLVERYYFAIVAYSTIAVIFYLMALNCVLLLITYLIPTPPTPDEVIPTLYAVVRLTLAIPVTVSLMVLVPHVPVLHGGVGALRSMMQALARYPQTVETLTAIISRSSFAFSARATSEVTRELKGYGVSAKLIENALADDNKVLAVGAATMIQQVCSLHSSFDDLRNDSRFQKFFSVRKDVFDNLEKQYRRVLRRSARALFLAEDISGSDQDPGELALEISDFIAEECEDLRVNYQRLLAEASISCVFGRANRTKLILSFGYQIFLPRTLPFAPLIVIFVLDFVFSVVPVIILSSLPNLPAEFKLTLRAAVLTALAHACALTLSVFFAIYPKTATNFARPSLLTLPWRSYIFFGLVSYLVGTAVTYLTYRMSGLPSGWAASSHPLAASSLFSLIFLINTVILSILLDVRLRNTSLDYYHARFRDGMTLAIVNMSVVVILLVGLIGLTAFYGMSLPNIPRGIYVLSILLFGVLGFVMGYLIPSTAEAHIEANKLTLRAAEKEGMLLGWATQQYRPRVAVKS